MAYEGGIGAGAGDVGEGAEIEGAGGVGAGGVGGSALRRGRAWCGITEWISASLKPLAL